MIDYTKVYVRNDTAKGFDTGLREYMLKIYTYMAMALVITGVAAIITISFPPLTYLLFQFGPNNEFLGTSFLGMLVMFAPLGIAIYFFLGIGSMDIKKAEVLFWVYAVFTGMSLSSLGYIYTGESIAINFFICSSVFAAMSLYGYTTQRDLTSMGSFLVMGMIGIVVASLINMIFKSPAVYYITSLIGVGIFMGIIAWDTQKLKTIYYSGGMV